MTDHGLQDDDVSGQELDQPFHSYQEQGTWHTGAVRQTTGKGKRGGFHLRPLRRSPVPSAR